MSPSLRHEHLGRVAFDPTHERQRAQRALRLRGEDGDLLLTLEHAPPVLTAGRRARDEHLLHSRVELAELGIELRVVERGGDWTYHGPGQLVAYPIVSIRDRGIRVTDFVAALELSMVELATDALLEAGASLDERIEIGRRCGHPGTWIRRRNGELAKIGAVGVHFHHFVSLHGLALNVDPEPWGFRFIVPCGLPDEITSLRRLCEELGGDPRRLPSIAVLGERLAVLLPKLWRPGSREPCTVFDGSPQGPGGQRTE